MLHLTFQLTYNPNKRNLEKENFYMDIRVLQYFLAVAREESITKAAERLRMTQPPLSRQLKDLEDELGKQLLIRGSKKSYINRGRHVTAQTCRRIG